MAAATMKHVDQHQGWLFVAKDMTGKGKEKNKKAEGA
jgi:hypothetical protein